MGPLLSKAGAPVAQDVEKAEVLSTFLGSENKQHTQTNSPKKKRV